MINMVKRVENLSYTISYLFFILWWQLLRVFVDEDQIYEILIKDGVGNTWAFIINFSFMWTFFILNTNYFNNVVVGGNLPGFYFDQN